MIGGCAVWLDGVNDYVTLGIVAARDFTASPFTICAWVYPAALGATPAIIGHGAINTNGYQLDATAAGAVRLRTNQAGASTLLASANGLLPLNAWSFVAGVKNGANSFVMLNGDIVASGSLTNPVASAGATAVGSNSNGLANYWSGAIDEPAFFNAALTQEQVRAYMYSQLTSLTANCVSLHHFDDGLSNFLGTNANATIGVTAGTLTNGASWVYDRWAPWVEPRVSSTANIAIAGAAEQQITGTLRRFIPRVKTRVSIAAQWDLLATVAGAGSIRCLMRENGVALAHESTLNIPAAGPLLRLSMAHVAVRDWNASTVYTLDLAARLNLAGDAIRATTQFPHTGYAVVAMPVDGTW